MAYNMYVCNTKNSIHEWPSLISKLTILQKAIISKQNLDQVIVNILNEPLSHLQ